MFNPALLNLVVVRAGSAGRTFDRFLARSVGTARGARQYGYDGVGERRDLSLIPLDHSCVAGMDPFVGLECTGCHPRAIGSLTRGGQGCTPRRLEQCVLSEFRLEMLHVDVERQLCKGGAQSAHAAQPAL